MLRRIFAAIMFTWILLAAGEAGACNDRKVPAAGTHNAWFCYSSSDTVVVFVHGFTSDSRLAWYREPTGSAPSAYWPLIVYDDGNLNPRPEPPDRPAVFLAGYPTAFDSTDYDMHLAAEDLFRALQQPIDGTPPMLEKRNIIFVAHSLGGIITRDVLVNHIQSFAGKRLGLLLVASPSKGSRYANTLLPPKWFAANRVAEQLQEGSDFLKNLNSAFQAAIKPPGPLAELVGKEIFEHRVLVSEEPDAGLARQFVRAAAETIAQKWLLGPVVPEASATGFFPNPELIYDSNHITIAHPRDENDKQEQVFRELYKRVLYAVPTPCQPPRDFNLVVQMDLGPWPVNLPDQLPESGKSSYPSFELLRYDGLGALVSRYTAGRAPTGLYRFPISDSSFVCPGEEFAATLQRLPARSDLVTASVPFTDACFQRSPDRMNVPFTKLRCREGEGCELDVGMSGLGDACQGRGPALTQARVPPSGANEQHWSVPSLETLEQRSEELRQGYTEFIIQSGPLPGNAGATHLSYAVKVNGVPVYMDGLAPHFTRIPYSSKGGVHLHFAIENLGFTGGTDGYENIAVEIRFYRAEELLRTAIIERPYISYRHAPELKLNDANSADAYSWIGFYRPAKVQPAYEVMLTSGPQSRVLHQRDVFDRRRREFQGTRTIGVIRPGRKENPTYGMTVGLALPTGQVKSLFTRDEAAQLCNWIVASADLSDQAKEMSYIFEFPAETFTDMKDRGRIAGRCKNT